MSDRRIFKWAQRGNVQELSILLLSVSEINLEVRNQKGQTPLHVAVENGHRSFAHTLLNSGANPNCLDHLGNTPLMKAAQKGDLSLFKLLIQNGSNIEIENSNKMTAYDWAHAFHRRNIIFYLSSYGHSKKSELKAYFGAFKQLFQEIIR
ncbi:ankyrin repeat domain-containing protein [Halobacteriovorax sp. YZS-1-1]|uniref:ankyrin repeat domain-containing protein n=1 Tax=unclassified Halobacteriovorax TaxID=2639665 RepID=UPI00399B13CB